MKKSSQGQSLTEYGMVLALVAVVSIAGLALFGQNLSDVFTNLVGGNASSGGNAVAAAPAAPPPLVANLSNTTPASEANPAQTPVQRPVMTASYDPQTGQIAFSTSGGSTDGKTTTGSQGTEQIAQALLYLAKTATKDDGTPADPQLTNLITQLANKYHKLADQEATITLPPSTDTSSAAYKQYYYSGVPQTQGEAYEIYNSIQALAKRDPNYSKVMGQVTDYAGIASSIYLATYDAQYNPASTPESRAQSLAGTDVMNQPVSIELAPPTTHVAAGSLDKTGKQVP